MRTILYSVLMAADNDADAIRASASKRARHTTGSSSLTDNDPLSCSHAG